MRRNAHAGLEGGLGPATAFGYPTEKTYQMDAQTLMEWEEDRVSQEPTKQWGAGWLFLLSTACAAFLFLYHESLPLPYPLAPICFVCVAIIFFVVGAIRYKAGESRFSDRLNYCRHCGKVMEEYIIDMPRSQLEKAVLSRRGLLHRFIVKEKLFEGCDGRVYMTGQKSYAPGMGYPGWKRTAFLLRAKWRACTDCQCSFIQDTVFEVVAKTDPEIEALVKDKEEIG